jgi:hypothetical protein
MEQSLNSKHSHIGQDVYPSPETEASQLWDQSCKLILWIFDLATKIKEELDCAESNRNDKNIVTKSLNNAVNKLELLAFSVEIFQNTKGCWDTTEQVAKSALTDAKNWTGAKGMLLFKPVGYRRRAQGKLTIETFSNA